MKATHEAVALVGGSPDRELRERFVDLSLSANLQLPTNFKQLDLSGCEHLFFLEARKLMQAVADLPNLTRSLYAQALAYSYVGDLYLYCDPVELEHRLGQTACQLHPHFNILQNHGLMWVPEYKEAWPNPSGPGYRSYFRQFDQDDSGIYFLWLMRTRYASEKTDLVDIIQNLNFNLLDL